ncbi:hypothetical protein SESBI_24966 [Sesbania bispinosa]|nr:hypothetical protein SESBI_24966 [Sesbania bispinosa]
MAMVPSHFHSIKSLCGLRQNWRLRVKLVRVWNMDSIATPNDPFSTQMVLIDEESDAIKKTNGRSEYLIDFMGIVTAVSEEINLSKEGRETQLMLIDLVDEMGQIRLALFGDMIDVVAGYLGLPRCGLPVLIIQLAKVNLYKGEVGIQNVMNASKVYWNPDMPEALEFRNGIMEQLHQMEEDGFFVIMGTVEQVIEDGFWWYMACPCMKFVSYDYGVPFCDDCGVYVIDLTPRFKLKTEVSDATDTAHLILFDSECYAMLHKSCRDTLAKMKSVKNCDHPSDISNLVGSEFLFRVERKNHASFTFEECFRVKRVCSDPSIIADYKIGIDEETPLKLKFAPLFTKIIDEERPTVDVEDGGSVNKREAQQSTDGQYERKKRPGQKVMKVEKN